MNGDSTIGAGLTVTAGTVTMNGTNDITGSVGVTGGTLTLGGANTISAGVSVTTGTLNLNAANTIAGGVTLNSGILNIGHAGALGANAFTINSGTINATVAGATSTNNDQTWNGSFTFTGTNSLNMGNGDVTLTTSPTLTVSANTLTVEGVIDDGASTFGLTKTGAGGLTLGAANTYGGATVINQGTVTLNATQNLSAATNLLTFGSTAGSTSVVTLTLASGVDATFGGTFTAQTNSASANTINIPANQTLRLNGRVNIGYQSTTANTTTKVTMTGGGTLTIGAAGQPTNSNVQLGGNSTGATGFTNAATLDLSGLSTFYANLGTGTLRVGDEVNGTGVGTGNSTLILAANSTIIATTITSDSPGSPPKIQAIKLGSADNVFNATTITIGGAANRAVGTLDFNGPTGTLKIRNLAGTGRADMNVQNGSSSTTADISGTVDLSGHGADLLLGTLAIAGRSAGTTVGGTGSFTYDTVAAGAPGGVGLDATTVNVAARTGSTLTTGSVTGTLNIGANATIGTLTLATNSSSASTTGDATAIVNITGGTNTITTLTMGVNTVSGATGNGSDTIATLSISGGTTTVGTTFSMGAQNSANNAATTVNTATSTLNISAGSLILSGSTNLTMGSTTLDVNNAAAATINLTGTGLLRVGGNITAAVFAGSTVTNTLNLDGGTLDMDGGNLGATATPVVFNAKSGTLMNAALINTTAGLTKTTAGILTLSGTSNGWTGDTAFAADGGTIRLGSGTAIPDGSGKGNLVTSNGLVDLNGYSETVNGLTGTGTIENQLAATTSTLTLGNNNTTSSFGGLIRNGTGIVALTKTGSGTATFTTANSFTGGTTLAGGTIQLDQGGALGDGTVTFSGTGVRLAVAGGQTFSNPIVIGSNTGASGRGLIEASGTGTATISGPITINNNASAGGHFAGVSGTTLLISNVITSSVAVTQRDGTVVYSGGGTGYSNFTLTGTAQIGANNGLATTATLSLGASAAAFLDLGGFNQSLVGIVKSTNAATIGNSSTSADSVLTITGPSVSWAGVIQDVIGSGTRKTGLTVDGGSLTLTAANTFTGAATVNSGSLTLTGSGSVDSALALSLTGTTPSFSFSGITPSSLTLGSLSGVAGSTVAMGAKGLTVGGNNGSTTFSGVLSGSAALTKQGTGVLTLDGNNDYTGATTVSQGILAVGSATALGTSAAGTTVTGGASGASSLRLQGGITVTGESLALTVTSDTTGNAALVNASGNNFWTGNVSLDTGTHNTFRARFTSDAGLLTVSGNISFTGSGNKAFVFGGAGDGVLSGQISGALPLFKDGVGTWTLSGDNSAFSGVTTVGNGVLEISSESNLGAAPVSYAAAQLTLGSGASNQGTLRTSANTSLSANRGVTLASGGGAFDVADATTLTVGSVITGAAALAKSGAGNLVLSAGNTFSGAITITAGKLQIGAGSTTGSVGAGAISNAGTLEISRSDDLSFDNVISGAGAFIKSGDGALTLSGANDYTGATTVSAGVLIVGDDSALGTSAGATSVTSGAELRLQGGRSIASEAVTLNGAGISSGGALRNFTGTNALGGAVTLASASRINSDAGTLTLTGGISSTNLGLTIGGAGNVTIDTLGLSLGSGSLTKDGAGTLLLSVANTYSGGTTISGGILRIGIAGALGSQSVLVNSDATLDLNGILISNIITISGTGSVIGGQSVADAPTTGTVNNVLTGSSGITKSDAGDLVFTTPNFYSGATQVTGADAVIKAAFLSDASSSLGVSDLTNPDNLIIGGGATLEFTGATNTSTARSFTIAGAGTIAATGTGTLQFNSSSEIKLTGDNPVLELFADNAGVNRFESVLAAGSGLIDTIKIDGTGQWVLGGAVNRFRGDVRVDVNGGTFGFESGSLNDLATGAEITVANGATLAWAGTNTKDVSDYLNVPAGTAKLDLGSNVVEMASVPTMGAGSSLSVIGGTLKVTVNSSTKFTDTAGTLIVNGTVGDVALASGGTLGGSGTVGDVTTVSGSVISPGNSPDTLTFTNWAPAGGTIIDWEVLNAGPSRVAGTDYDTIRVTGNLNLAGVTSVNRITIKVTSLDTILTDGPALNFNSPDAEGMMPRTFTLMTIEGSILNQSGSISDLFAFDFNDFDHTNLGAVNPNYWSVSSFEVGGDTQLIVTAVPEPSTYGFGLGALALAAAAIRRRRKMKAEKKA
jgi:autotransporter-associated beta strand protein